MLREGVGPSRRPPKGASETLGTAQPREELGGEEMTGFVCSCRAGPAALPTPGLSAPPAPLRVKGRGWGLRGWAARHLGSL